MSVVEHFHLRGQHDQQSHAGGRRAVDTGGEIRRGNPDDFGTDRPITTHTPRRGGKSYTFDIVDADGYHHERFGVTDTEELWTEQQAQQAISGLADAWMLAPTGDQYRRDEPPRIEVMSAAAATAMLVDKGMTTYSAGMVVADVYAFTVTNNPDKIYFVAGDEQVSGKSWPRPEPDISLWMPSARNVSPERYTAAHEYAHIRMIRGEDTKAQMSDAKGASLGTPWMSMSKYGRTDIVESHAETFAEIVMTGGSTTNQVAQIWDAEFGWTRDLDDMQIAAAAGDAAELPWLIGEGRDGPIYVWEDGTVEHPTTDELSVEVFHLQGQHDQQRHAGGRGRSSLTDIYGGSVGDEYESRPITTARGETFLIEAEVETADDGSDGSVSGVIIDEDGSTVGSFSREFDFERGVVDNSSLNIDEDRQGEGIGTAFLEATEGDLENMGITRARVTAVDVGQYAWAARGYRVLLNDRDKVIESWIPAAEAMIAAEPGEFTDTQRSRLGAVAASWQAGDDIYGADLLAVSDRFKDVFLEGPSWKGGRDFAPPDRQRPWFDENQLELDLAARLTTFHLQGQHDQQRHAGVNADGDTIAKVGKRIPSKRDADDVIAEWVAPEEEFKAAQALAAEKARNVPRPTQAQIDKNLAALEKAKEGGRAGGELRGNSYTRRARAEALFKEFGGDKRGYCPCGHCGIKVSPRGEGGHAVMQQDKILTATEGGTYGTPTNFPNLIPSCGGCNSSRNDEPYPVRPAWMVEEELPFAAAAGRPDEVIADSATGKPVGWDTPSLDADIQVSGEYVTRRANTWFGAYTQHLVGGETCDPDTIKVEVDTSEMGLSIEVFHYDGQHNQQNHAGGGRRPIPPPPRRREGRPRPGGALPDVPFRDVRIAYRPRHPDGKADPGEVVWARVPFEEGDGRSKDRPVLIIGRTADGEHLVGVQLTSKSGRDRVPVGTGEWDHQRRESYMDTDRFIQVDENNYRREGAYLKKPRFQEIVDVLTERQNAPDVDLAARLTVFHAEHNQKDHGNRGGSSRADRLGPLSRNDNPERFGDWSDLDLTDQDAVKAAAESFAAQLTAERDDDIEYRVRWAVVNDGSTTVSIDAYSPTKQVAAMTRLLEHDRGTMRAASLDVDEEFQGQGVGSQMREGFEDFASSIGMREAFVGATNVGVYAWARAGYDWAPYNNLREIGESIRADAPELAALFDQAPAGSNREVPDFVPTPWEVSEVLGADKMKAAIGSWGGVKPLGQRTKDELSVEVFHLQGQHDQDSHGNRVGGTATVVSPAEAVAALNRGEAVNIAAADAPRILVEIGVMNGGVVDMTNLSIDGDDYVFTGVRAAGRRSRSEMPQIPEVRIDDFRAHLEEEGVQFVPEMVNPLDVRSTQTELDATKVGQMIARVQDGNYTMGHDPWVSSDGFILDGHHRWATMAVLEAAGQPHPPFNITRVSMPIDKLLVVADEFNEIHDVQRKTIHMARIEVFHLQGEHDQQSHAGGRGKADGWEDRRKYSQGTENETRAAKVFSGQFEVDGYSYDVETVTTRDEYGDVKLEGRIFDVDGGDGSNRPVGSPGDEVGKFMRTIHKSGRVTNDVFIMNDDYQGARIGTAFLDYTEQRLQEEFGTTEIELKAVETGRYAWAARGYGTYDSGAVEQWQDAARAAVRNGALGTDNANYRAFESVMQDWDARVDAIEAVYPGDLLTITPRFKRIFLEDDSPDWNAVRFLEPLTAAAGVEQFHYQGQHDQQNHAGGRAAGDPGIRSDGVPFEHDSITSIADQYDDSRQTEQAREMKHNGAANVAVYMDDDTKQEIADELNGMMINDVTADLQAWDVVANVEYFGADLERMPLGVAMQMSSLAKAWDDIIPVDGETSEMFQSAVDDYNAGGDPAELSALISDQFGISVAHGAVDWRNAEWQKSAVTPAMVAFHLAAAKRHNLYDAERALRGYYPSGSYEQAERISALVPTTVSRVLSADQYAIEDALQMNVRRDSRDTVTVFRGVKDTGHSATAYDGEGITTTQGNPLTSWTVDRGIANSFAGQFSTEGGYILTAEVPASQIVGMSTVTGWGSVREREVILLGEPIQLSDITPVNRDSE